VWYGDALLQKQSIDESTYCSISYRQDPLLCRELLNRDPSAAGEFMLLASHDKELLFVKLFELQILRFLSGGAGEHDVYTALAKRGKRLLRIRL
jgi:hypothetical protein